MIIIHQSFVIIVFIVIAIIVSLSLALSNFNERKTSPSPPDSNWLQQNTTRALLWSEATVFLESYFWNVTHFCPLITKSVTFLVAVFCECTRSTGCFWEENQTGQFVKSVQCQFSPNIERQKLVLNLLASTPAEACFHWHVCTCPLFIEAKISCVTYISFQT